MASANTTPFVFNVTADARQFLLREGTDMKYGARHLKRAIERSLVHPLSNLIASGQVHGGDLVRIDRDDRNCCLSFVKEAEEMPAYAMVQMMETQPLWSNSGPLRLKRHCSREQRRGRANAKGYRIR